MLRKMISTEPTKVGSEIIVNNNLYIITDCIGKVFVYYEKARKYILVDSFITDGINSMSKLKVNESMQELKQLAIDSGYRDYRYLVNYLFSLTTIISGKRTVRFFISNLSKK